MTGKECVMKLIEKAAAADNGPYDALQFAQAAQAAANALALLASAPPN